MAMDPTDPETFAEAEGEDVREGEGEEYGVEAPRADTAEQRAEVRPDRDDPLTDADRDRADEADLAEQARIVSDDEDDYR